MRTLLLLALVAGALADELSVMTYNIRVAMDFEPGRAWPERCDLVIAEIAGAGVDIVGLQEDLAPQAHQVREGLPDFDAVGRGNWLVEEMGAFNSILYRRDRFERLDDGIFWLSDTPEEPGSMTWEQLYPRSVVWCLLRERATGRRLRVYNTHLPHAHAEARRKGLRLIAERIGAERAADPVPTVLLGDFNLAIDSPALRALAGPEGLLRDAFAVAEAPGPDHGTYHGFSGRTDRQRIDHILVSPELTVLSTAIRTTPEGQLLPSDHFPVVARIRVPE